MSSFPLEHMAGHLKMRAWHLERQAVVYVRQSSAKQVRTNTESQANQRALVARAVGLGWHQERIQMLDGDLGQSASSVEGRDDFKSLTAAVALGQVGIIFGWEVSRLARNNADWYHLLDLAALFGTLIADVEGIYDPRLYNDRLLLGLKGTMSEAELHIMRQRLHAGRLSKVMRGELVQHLPTGLVRLSPTEVVKDPDDQVRHTIELVLAKFAELGSGQKTLRCLQQHGILLPRRQTSGLRKGELLWRKPAAAAVLEIVHNPAYAGAFAYGRRPTDPRQRRPGRQSTGMVRKPLAEWICIRQNAYPAYITWEQYLANQERLHENALRHEVLTRPGRGAPRQGAALLQGLATCGECGHRMKVAYKPRIRYNCDGLSKNFAERMCGSLDGTVVEAAVVRAFFAALAPAQLDALEALLVQRRQEHGQIERHWQEQAQRAAYEANLARRRYEAVDPDNRLVAAELERRWEEKLVALRQAEEAAARFLQQPLLPPLDPALRRQLEHIAQSLPELWVGGQLSNEHKKELLRSLIARVILKRTAADQVEVKIVWVSGHFSVEYVTPPIWRQSDVTGYAEMVARLRTLWEEGHPDAEIAATLTQEGFHSARDRKVSKATVLKIRDANGWLSSLHRHRLADMVDGMWTIHGLSRELGVHPDWFYRRIHKGILRKPDLVRTPAYGNYLIRDDAALLSRLRRETQAPQKSHAKSQS